MNFIQKEIEDYKVLLRNIPGLVVTVFAVSVVMMNILAGKELFTTELLALDCGFAVSWISFLCMDVICKRFGPKASAKIAILALVINFIACIVFKLMSLTSGKWSEYYSTGIDEVNEALNATIGGYWYVVLGSSIAMLFSSIVNSLVNSAIAQHLKKDDFKAFALRSYISTAVAQFTDNLIFAVIVSYRFFGWTAKQILFCSITSMCFELLCEMIFGPIGYRISKRWAAENVGEGYLEYLNRNEDEK